MTVSPSESFTSSDCTAEWTVFFFFLVLSRMDSLCPARFPLYPSRIPLLSTSPPLHTHLVPLHRSHHPTASPAPTFLLHTPKGRQPLAFVLLYFPLYTYFFSNFPVVDHPVGTGLSLSLFTPTGNPSHWIRRPRTLFSVLPRRVSNNNSPLLTINWLSSYTHHTPCLEPSGFL